MATNRSVHFLVTINYRVQMWGMKDLPIYISNHKRKQGAVEHPSGKINEFPCRRKSPGGPLGQDV